MQAKKCVRALSVPHSVSQSACVIIICIVLFVELYFGHNDNSVLIDLFWSCGEHSLISPSSTSKLLTRLLVIPLERERGERRERKRERGERETYAPTHTLTRTHARTHARTHTHTLKEREKETTLRVRKREGRKDRKRKKRSEGRKTKREV